MSIRQKILFSIIGVIFLMFISLSSVFVFHTTAVREYRQISNNLILENQLAQNIVEIVDVYNSLVIAPGSDERLAQYQEQQAEIESIFTELDQASMNSDSRVAYEGLRRIAQSILDDTARGLETLEEDNATEALDLYNSVLHKRGFVTENTTSLLLTEIRHLYEIRQTIEERYNQQLSIMTIWVAVLVATAVIYSFIFARRITGSIKELSIASKKVTRGDYDLDLSHDLLTREDEVGSLAQSFKAMLEKLNAKITQVETANNTVLETQRHLKERNAELERFNKMVIGRELKMVELKREIAVLESKISKLEQGQ